MVIALTRHYAPQVRLEHFDYPPPLNTVNIGDSPAAVRRKMGAPVAVHRSPGEVCWDYVFPTSTPHYRLCFLQGRLAMRTPY
jgi:hypothetical protein